MHGTRGVRKPTDHDGSWFRLALLWQSPYGFASAMICLRLAAGRAWTIRTVRPAAMPPRKRCQKSPLEYRDAPSPMKQLRMVLWLLLLAAFAGFIAMNADPARVNFWPLGPGYLHFEWPVGFVALVFFLAGFLPPWLAGRVRRWRLKRRIAALESSIAPTPGAHSTHDAAFDAAQTDL